MCVCVCVFLIMPAAPRSVRKRTTARDSGGTVMGMNMNKAMRMAEKYETCILVVFFVMCLLAGALVYVWLTSSGNETPTTRSSSLGGEIPPPDSNSVGSTGRTTLSATVEGEFPHDRQAFTQG